MLPELEILDVSWERIQVNQFLRRLMDRLVLPRLHDLALEGDIDTAALKALTALLGRSDLPPVTSFVILGTNEGTSAN